ncbi:MAG: hypothetical protein BMS9Abin25_0492 [Gammaproteobacteria bacterium]|nr:MAG: hypothetical protein BMS9Abin25_0492 [Gammaproteobacteria bacterium]
MKKPLKQQLNQYFRQVELSGPQLTELESLINTQTEKESQRRGYYGRNLAAVGMFFVAVVTLFMMSQFPWDASKDMPRLIAEEVVKNHLKLKPLEVKAETINAIRGYFSKLEFMPVESNMVSGKGMQLIGGRYCSLQGITAAQLRMKQGRNLQTLYQTQYLPEVFGQLPQLEKGEAPLIVYAKGIKVKIWVEKGLLFALTQAPDVSQSQE